MERFTRWAMGVAVWVWGGLALAQTQGIPTNPAEAAKTAGSIAEIWSEAGPYGTAVIFLGTTLGLWWTARKDRAKYDEKNQALNEQVVKILQDFLHDKK